MLRVPPWVTTAGPLEAAAAPLAGADGAVDPPALEHAAVRMAVAAIAAMRVVGRRSRMVFMVCRPFVRERGCQ